MRTVLAMLLMVGSGCATTRAQDDRGLYVECGQFLVRHGRDNAQSRGCAEALDKIDEGRDYAVGRAVLKVIAGTAEDARPKAEITCTPIVGGAPEYGMRCTER